ALAEHEQPALVILDLLMPEMDGFAVVEGLHARAATTSIPIVILTSHDMRADERERLNGHISYLARKGSFNRGEFVKLVHDLCPVPAASAPLRGGPAWRTS